MTAVMRNKVKTNISDFAIRWIFLYLWKYRQKLAGDVSVYTIACLDERKWNREKCSRTLFWKWYPL